MTLHSVRKVQLLLLGCASGSLLAGLAVVLVGAVPYAIPAVRNAEDLLPDHQALTAGEAEAAIAAPAAPAAPETA